MRENAPLASLIQQLEQIREACYVCDRAPLDDMIDDLRRWSSDLAPPLDLEIPTAREGQGPRRQKARSY